MDHETLGVTEDAAAFADEQTYRAAVAARLKDLKLKGVESLFEACRRGGGAFPTLVRDVARSEGIQLALARPVDWIDDEGPGELAGLTEPHPLDFEWRFTTQTGDFIAERLIEYAGHAGTIGCFGTPTVYAKLIRSGRMAILLDKNPAFHALSDSTQRTLSRHPDARVHTTDLRNLAASGSIPLFDVALLDPPWYVDHTLVWIERALSHLKPGGTIVVSVFSELLRPAAKEERALLFHHMSSLGELARLERDANYLTPLFERETLAASGIPDLGAWRTGELYSLRVNGRGSLSAPLLAPEAEWQRVQFGTQVVAVRETSAVIGPLDIGPATVDGSFLMRSVSSRDPVREHINLLTSRNRAARVSDSARVMTFLRSIASGTPVGQAIASADPDDRAALATVQALIGL